MIFKKELERIKSDLVKKNLTRREEISRINQAADSAKNKREMILPILQDMKITERSIAGVDLCLVGNGVCFIATVRIKGKIMDLLVCENVPPIASEDEAFIIISREAPIAIAINEKGAGDSVTIVTPGGKQEVEIIDMYIPQ